MAPGDDYSLKARRRAGANGVKTMEDLFRDYWWLMFPLFWLIGGAFHSAQGYRRDRDRLDLIKTYADKGQEPPEALLKALDRDRDDDSYYSRRRCRRGGWRHEGSWFSVVFFGIMAAGFGYASYHDIYGAGEGFLIVTVVLGALAVASLVSILVGGGYRSDKD